MANKSKSGGLGISLNKASFWLLVATAIIYLVAMILSMAGVNLKIVSALQGLASALMIVVVAILAWRYVSKKQTVWKVLYFVVLLVIILAIILPLII